MVTGIALILAGVLIAIYPPLLSLIVAAFLILLGIVVAMSAHYHRRLERHADNPVVDLIFRF